METWWDQWDLRKTTAFFWSSFLSQHCPFNLYKPTSSGFLCHQNLPHRSLTFSPYSYNSAAFLQSPWRAWLEIIRLSIANSGSRVLLSSELINPVKLPPSRLLCHWQRRFCLSDFSLFATGCVTPALCNLNWRSPLFQFWSLKMFIFCISKFHTLYHFIRVTITRQHPSIKKWTHIMVNMLAKLEIAARFITIHFSWLPTIPPSSTHAHAISPFFIA